MKITVGNIAELIEKHRNRKGFTLIEMAIVLVIIGIILGAIMKGQDVMRSAQSKQFWQNFAGKYVTAADSYYDKTGQNFADGERNGGIVGTAADGFSDRMGIGNQILLVNPTVKATIRDVYANAGINLCETIKSGNFNDPTTCPGTGVDIANGQVTSELYGKVSNVGVVFANQLLPATGTMAARASNFIIFTSVPLDIAQAIDTIADGVASGNSGRVLNFGCQAVADAVTLMSLAYPVATTAFTPADWPAATAATAQKCYVAYKLEH